MGQEKDEERKRGTIQKAWGNVWWWFHRCIQMSELFQLYTLFEKQKFMPQQSLWFPVIQWNSYFIHFTYFFPKWKITYKKRIMTIYNKGNLRDYLIYFPLFQKRKLASREVDLPKVITSLVMTRKELLAVLFLYYLVLWVF